MVGSTSISMYVPHGIGQVLDSISDQSSSSNVIPLLTTMSAVFVAGTGINFGRIAIFKWANEKIVNNVRKALFDAYLSKEMSFFDKGSTGDIITRFASDAPIAGKAITSNLSDAIKNVGQGIVGTVMMYGISAKLCACLIGILPPIAILGIFFGKIVKKISFQSQESLSACLSFAEERFSSIKTVKIFGREKEESSAFSKKIESILALARKESIAAGSMYAMTGALANASLIFLLSLSSSMILANEITIGALTSFLMYTAYVGGSVSRNNRPFIKLLGLSNVFSEFLKGYGAFERIAPLLGPILREPRARELESPILRGHVSFENVKFTYFGKEGEYILDGFTAPQLACPGKITVLVGPSGKGKSTLISLLLRLYPVSSGKIMIDNTHNLESIDLNWLKEKVAVVPQDPQLFQESIANNIAYGKIGASDQEIMEAAKLANAHGFIENLPNRYDTVIGERGCTLSGGQRQRIALTRALIKNASILILDEPTSALDTENESLIHKMLQRLAADGISIVIITHKEATAAIADLKIELI